MTIHLPILPRHIIQQALFNPEAFRGEIVSFGGGCPNIRWEKAFPCPCAWRTTFSGEEGEVGGESRPGCLKCRNTGVYYVRQADTYAIVTDAAGNSGRGKNTGDSWLDVQARFTCLPETAPAYQDRLTILTAWLQVSERRKRRLDTEALRFPIEVRDIVSASANDPSTPICVNESVIRCSHADSDGAYVGELEEGVHFTVVDGSIVWEASPDPDSEVGLGDPWIGGPSQGCDYTITYWIHPRYVIQGLPFIHRPQPTRKPQQVGADSAVDATDMPVRATGNLETVGVAAGTTGV